MKNTDKVSFIQTKEQIDFTTGEIVKSETQTNWKIGTEPNFIKLYFDCLLTFNDLSKSLNPILIQFLKHMTYASTADNSGGQLIFLNAELKRYIASCSNLKIDRINQAITEFVKANIFKRIGVGTYQVNPNMFGKGEWKDIKAIKANFDFNTGDVNAEIIKKEDNLNEKIS